MQLAASVGQRLRGGEVIELTSDLGGGKTTFVRGLAQGMGATDAVHSPSFTITNEYKAGDLTIDHFDFYRLEEAGIMRDELAEALMDTKVVVVVEWAGLVKDVLPRERLSIMIKPTGETSRALTFTYPETYEYLIQKT